MSKVGMLLLVAIAISAVAAVAATPIMANANNGVPDTGSFGQCKQVKNDQACKSVVKPGNG